MSKIETDNFEITPEPFPPAQVIAVAATSWRCARARPASTLDKSLTDDLPDMIADKRALSQILINLLSNAIRFTDRGGKMPSAPARTRGHVTFVVEDNGVGINEEDLARVGEPFFQARASYDRRHGGTGLGLSIVKGLVRLHGGDSTSAAGSARARASLSGCRSIASVCDCPKPGRRLRNDAMSHFAGPSPKRAAAPRQRRVGGRGWRLECDVTVKKSA